MKQTIMLSKKQPGSRQKRMSASLRLFLIAATLMSFALPNRSMAQQFVKTYKSYSPCTQANGNLVFNAITRSKKTVVTFYVAGVQDSSIYIAEVDAMGVVLQEKLIGVKSNTYLLQSMITDEDGNIVIVGRATNTFPYVSYFMKISPALSLLLHRIYNNADLSTTNRFYFTDVKDYKLSSTYYISGLIGNTNPNAGAGDAMLIRIDRNTGAIIKTYRGDAKKSDEGYDALVFAPYSTTNPPAYPDILATGSIIQLVGNNNRSFIGSHNSNLAFVKGARYLQDQTPLGRLYSSSLINDGLNVLYCWDGNVASTSTAASGMNAGISSLSYSTLLPNWQKEYSFSPKAQTRVYLTKIAIDPSGYVAEGNWWNGSSTATAGGVVGEMILLRTDKTGGPIWSRKINNVFVNNITHNASFVVEGNSIFAVGYKPATTLTQSEGVLVRIPLLNGAMDTSCATVQTVQVKEYQFSKQDSLSEVAANIKDSTFYYPINCTGTDAVTNCNQPCTDTLKPDADFDLAGKLIKGASNFIVTADNFNTVPNSQWIVSEVDLTTFLDKPATVWVGAPNGPWGVSTSTQFNGYYGAENATGAVGFFGISKRFRFKHILTSTNYCGITKADTVVKTIYMCPGCKTTNGGNGIMVETEKASSSGNTRSHASQLPATESADVRIMPNPVSGSTITVEYAAQNNSPVHVNIQDMQGRKLVGKQFTANTKTNGRYTMDVSTLSNGTYAMVINNDGKTTTQKFVVAR